MMRQKLYLCATCAHTETVDVPVRGPMPKRTHAACGRMMVPTLPSLVPSLIRKAREAAAEQTAGT